MKSSKSEHGLSVEKQIISGLSKCHHSAGHGVQGVFVKFSLVIIIVFCNVVSSEYTNHWTYVCIVVYMLMLELLFQLLFSSASQINLLSHKIKVKLLSYKRLFLEISGVSY